METSRLPTAIAIAMLSILSSLVAGGPLLVAGGSVPADLPLLMAPPTRTIVEESESNNNWGSADLLPKTYGGYELHGNLTTSSDFDYFYINLVGGSGPVDQVTLTPKWFNASSSSDYIVAWFWVFFPTNTLTGGDDISMDLRMWAPPFWMNPISVSASYTGIYGLVVRPAFTLSGRFTYNISVDISSITPPDSSNDKGSSVEITASSIVFSSSLNAANDMFDWYHFLAPSPLYPTSLDLTLSLVSPSPDYNDGSNDWGVEVTIYIYHDSRASPGVLQPPVIYRTSMRPLFQNPGGCSPSPIRISLQRNCTEMYATFFIQSYVMDSRGTKTYGEGTGTTSYTADFKINADIPNNRPLLKDAGVSPSTGKSTDSFTFSVTYQDLNNETPRYIGVWLDGSHFRELSPLPGQGVDMAQGVRFGVSVPGSLIGRDKNHVFNFSALDQGGDWAKNFETGLKSISGPLVTDNLAPSSRVGNKKLVTIEEDSPTVWLDLDQLFMDPDEGTVFKYRLVTSKGAFEEDQEYRDANLTARIKNNATTLPSQYRLKVDVADNIAGRFALKVNASDQGFVPLSTEVEIMFDVQPSNDDPEILTINSEELRGNDVYDLGDVEQGERVEIRVYARDIDKGDVLDYTWDIEKRLYGADRGVNFDYDLETGSLWFVTSDPDVPGFDLMLTVTDGNGGSDQLKVICTIINVNDPPTIKVPPFKSTIEGEFLYINPEATDPDLDNSEDQLTFSYDLGDLAKIAPAGAIEFSDTTGRLTIKAVSERMNGEWEANISVYDLRGLSDWGICEFVIENVNDPPTVGTINSDIEDGNLTVLFFTSEAEDEDKDDVHTYIWDFGDGSAPSSGVNLKMVLHTFPNAGAFTVTMKVFDGQTYSETVEEVVTVTAPPPDKDKDDDNMDDEWELMFGLSPDDPLDADLDPDNDGLTNIEEFGYYLQKGKLLNPRNPDTDGDGYKDGEEVDSRTDPTDKANKPAEETLDLSVILWVVVGSMVFMFVVIMVVFMFLRTRNKARAVAVPTFEPQAQQYPEGIPPGQEYLSLPGQPFAALPPAYPQGDIQAGPPPVYEQVPPPPGYQYITALPAPQQAPQDQFGQMQYYQSDAAAQPMASVESGAPAIGDEVRSMGDQPVEPPRVEETPVIMDQGPTGPMETLPPALQENPEAPPGGAPIVSTPMGEPQDRTGVPPPPPLPSLD